LCALGVQVSFHLKSAINRSSFCHLLEMDDAKDSFQSVVVREFPLSIGLSVNCGQLLVNSDSEQSQLSDNSDSPPVSHWVMSACLTCYLNQSL